MKRKIIFLLLFLPFALTTFAQGPYLEANNKRKLAKMTIELKLTPDQHDRIDELNKRFLEQLKPLLIDRIANKEKIKLLKKEHHQEIKAVLTPPQLTQLKIIKQEKKVNMKKMRVELKVYRQKTIEPALHKKRTDFDKELTTTEHETIAASRRKIADRRKEMQRDKKKHSKGRGNKNSDKKRAMHEDLKSNLTPILKAHKVSLDSILLSLEPEKAKWKTDMKTIREKYTVKNSKNSEEGWVDRKNRVKNKHPEEKEMNEAIRFLLIKPSLSKK